MKNSDAQCDTDRVLSKLLDRLGGSFIQQEIDGRIDDAFGRFAMPMNPIHSSGELVKAIGELVAHIYATGLRLSLTLTPTQAQAGGLMLLNRHYRSADDHSFDSALLDVMDPRQNGLELVLTILMDIIKQRERESYTESVFLELLVPLSCEQRCALVEEIRHRCEAFLPPHLLTCHPAQLTDEIPSLFRTLLDVRDVLPRRHAT